MLRHNCTIEAISLQFNLIGQAPLSLLDEALSRNSHVCHDFQTIERQVAKGVAEEKKLSPKSS